MGVDTMDIDRDVTAFLQSQRRSAPPELAEAYAKFEDLYDKKLWHQLTIAVEHFVQLPSSGPHLIPLYENFIVDWEDKMNQLSLVQYATRASRELPDPSASLAFLSARADKIKEKPHAKDAYVLATMEAAHYKLAAGDLEGCKAAIDECEKILDELPGTETVINASFYRVSAAYYSRQAAYPQYYHNALLFLSSASLDDLSATEKQNRAYELAIAALMGEGLYNFGELLQHPILNSLKGTPVEWLYHLLFVFNSGDMAAFDGVSKSNFFKKQPVLFNSVAFLRQKLCLMTLIECVFRRDKEARGRMSFTDIAKESGVRPEDVEHLVMKALSLGLIKGKIDEVDNIVAVSWVQPRVLDKTQIGTIRDRLSEWSGKVRHQVIALEAEEGAKEVFVQ
ncbi:26S proteasome regulatory subunit [Borealophlyctis nickersoniae]|nr:26S proteasome regulatory subunit [Borealophlyctis nickersoniae]